MLHCTRQIKQLGELKWAETWVHYAPHFGAMQFDTGMVCWGIGGQVPSHKKQRTMAS